MNTLILDRHARAMASWYDSIDAADIKRQLETCGLWPDGVETTGLAVNGHGDVDQAMQIVGYVFQKFSDIKESNNVRVAAAP